MKWALLAYGFAPMGGARTRSDSHFSLHFDR